MTSSNTDTLAAAAADLDATVLDNTQDISFADTTLTASSKPYKQCESCNFNFNLFRKKRICYSCKLAYCRNCVEVCFFNTPLPLSSESVSDTTKSRRIRIRTTNRPIKKRPQTCRACFNCLKMSSPRTPYEQLMQIDTKYLRLYLASHTSYNLENRTDKSELVELVISSHDSSHTSSSSNRINTTSTSNNNGYEKRTVASNLTEVKSSKICTSLSDLTCLEEIGNLNINQMKRILRANFVHFDIPSYSNDDYSEEKEKEQLITKLKKLYISNEENKKLDSRLTLTSNSMSSIMKPRRSELSFGQDACKICMECVIDCVLLDCGHMIVCTKCARQLDECPICRSEVMKIIRVFKS